MPESLTDDQQHRRRKAVADVLPTTPFLKGLGIVFERYEPDDVTVRLPWREDLTNDGAYFHGGGPRGADLPDRVMTNSRSP